MSQNTNTETTLATAVQHHLGGDFAMNYFTYLHAEVGFVYIAIPGAANVRTVGSLNLAVAEMLGLEFEIKNPAQLYERKGTVVPNPKTEGFAVFNQMLEDEEVIKFTFIRDPVDRFAALYRKAFSLSTQMAPPREKLFKHLGMPIEENLSMLDLAELLLEEDDLKDLMPQFRSQRQMTAFDLIDYNFIGHHEHWPRDFAKISHEIFGRDVVQFDPVTAFKNDPERVALQGNIDFETRRTLQEVYRDDYDMIKEIEEYYPEGFAREF